MKYQIQVRNGDGTVVETISRSIRTEAIGNFCPMFCSYNGKKRCLVQSEALHLDDPLRCNEKDHIGKLYILPRGKDGKVVPTWKDAV